MSPWRSSCWRRRHEDDDGPRSPTRAPAWAGSSLFTPGRDEIGPGANWFDPCGRIADACPRIAVRRLSRPCHDDATRGHLFQTKAGDAVFGFRPEHNAAVGRLSERAPAHGRGLVRGRGARTQYGAGGALTCACTAKNFQPVSTSAMPAQPVEASTAPNVTIPPRYWRGRTLDPAMRGPGET